MSILTNIAQNFMNKEKFEVTKVSVDVKNLEFEFKGKVIQDKGFKVLNSKSENDDIIPDFKKHEEVDVELDLLQKETTPPKRFTEKTLLKAMANPLETLEDEGLKSTIKEAKGLGTPATRADIIENLKKTNISKYKKQNLYN